MRNSTKTLIYLGLVGGALLSFSPEVKAQVEVIGGDFSGPAGFFMPDTGDAIKLLDVSVKTLNIESSVGNTSTAIFTPTAASFANAGELDAVDVGDTGVLQGLLTGLAYDEDANPVIFTNVATELEFAVDSFEVAKNLEGGTLISPNAVGTAPLVFISRPVDVAGEEYKATLGNLDVGQLAATLNSGFIALLDGLNFQSDGGTGSTPVPELERRILFHFAGEEIADYDLNVTDDELQFAGEANQFFQIQTIGTSGTAEFQIFAPSGAVDITLGGVEGDDFTAIDTAAAVDYDIKGQAEGNFTAFLSNDQNVAQFDGKSKGDIQIRFQQGSESYDGRSNGSVAFTAAAGLASVDDIDFEELAFDPISDPAVCGACDDETEPLTLDDVSFVSIEDLLNEETEEPDTILDDSESLSDDEIEAVEGELADEDIDPDANLEINVLLVGLDRYYVAYPGKSFGKGNGNAFGRPKIFCFKQIGPGSSIFPGLITLEPVAEEDIPVEIVVGLPEIADADPGDDVDQEQDDDTSDVDDDQEQDDDDTSDTDDEEEDDDDTSDTDDEEEVIVVPGLNEIPAGDDAAADSDGTVIVPGLNEIP